MYEKPVTTAAEPLSRTTPEKRFSYRTTAGVVALVCLSILAVAAWIKPDPTGVGSHTQLGFRACAFHERTGYPCITCGVTTAFAHVVRAELLQAFTAQPAGALAALVCVFTALTAGGAALTGRGRDKFAHLLNTLCFHWAATLMVIIGVVMASWAWTCALTYFRTH